MSWEFIDAHWCDKCRKAYGKTNIEYKGMEVWAACDCTPKDRIYIVDTARIRLPDMQYLTADIRSGLAEQEAKRDE